MSNTLSPPEQYPEGCIYVPVVNFCVFIVQFQSFFLDLAIDLLYNPCQCYERSIVFPMTDSDSEAERNTYVLYYYLC